MSGPRPSPPGATRAGDALSSLLSDPLDQGYRDAARRRAERGPQVRGRRSAVLSAGGAFLIGLVLATALLNAHRSAPADARARADLRSRVTAAQHDAADLSRTARNLQSQADRAGAAALGAPANPPLDAARLQAGASSVRGPGITVELGNPPVPTNTAATGRPGSTPLAAAATLTDLDVRAVVNELWGLGAQAVAVNDIRLAPTSTIRFAGLAVLVDFQPVSAPYTVAAIGDSDALITAFTASPVAERYRTLASAYGVRWAVEQHGDIVLPASVVPDPRYAHVPSGTANPGSVPAPQPSTPSPPTSSPPNSPPPTPGGPS